MYPRVRLASSPAAPDWTPWTDPGPYSPPCLVWDCQWGLLSPVLPRYCRNAHGGCSVCAVVSWFIFSCGVTPTLLLPDWVSEDYWLRLISLQSEQAMKNISKENPVPSRRSHTHACSRFSDCEHHHMSLNLLLVALKIQLGQCRHLYEWHLLQSILLDRCLMVKGGQVTENGTTRSVFGMI